MAALCLVAGLLSLSALSSATRVLTDYHPAIPALVATGAPGSRISGRVVVVVISGVSNTDLDATGDPWRFLQLRRRAAEGSYGTARAVQPAGDGPTWAAIVTGASPALSGVVAPAAARATTIPTLFDEVRTQGMRSAVVMSRVAWQARALVGRADRPVMASSSSAVVDRAISVLREHTERLAVVLLDAGRAGSVSLADRLERVDAQLGMLIGTLDPARDTVIATGDHGFLSDGSSGGDEPAVVDVPLVLWGQNVTPRAIGVVDQRDIAPTVAALLGLPYSPFGGQPIVDGLRLSPPAEAAEYVRLLDVKAQNAEAASADTVRFLRTAQTLFRQADWAGATHAARAGLAAIDRPSVLPWYWASAWVWGGVLPLLLLGLARLASRFRSILRRLVLPLAGLAAYIVTWTVIYAGLAGKPFSLSAIYGDWNTSLLAVAVWSSLALAAVAAGTGFLRARQGAASAAFDLGMIALLVVGLLTGLILAYLLIGGVPHARLPGLSSWTMLLLALALITGAGLATPLAMLIAAAVGEIGSRGR